MALRRLAPGCAAVAVVLALSGPATAAQTRISTVAGGGALNASTGYVTATDASIPSPGPLAWVWNLTKWGNDFDWSTDFFVVPGNNSCFLARMFASGDTPVDTGTIGPDIGVPGDCAATSSTNDKSPVNATKLGHPSSIAVWANSDSELLIANRDQGRVEHLHFYDDADFNQQRGISTLAGSSQPAGCSAGTTPDPPDGVAATAAQFCFITAVATHDGVDDDGFGDYLIGEAGRGSRRGDVYIVSAGTVHHLASNVHVADLAFTSDGGVLIADGRDSVLKLTTTDPATTQMVVVVGVYNPADDTPNPGFWGDGQPASTGWLSAPTAIEPGYDGTFYIADSGNCRIRKVDGLTPDDTITTFAGTGAFCPIAAPLGDGGLASDAALNHPSSLQMSPGGLLVSDTGNNRVRLINRTSLLDGPPAITTDTTPTFTVASLDGDPHLQCHLGSADWADCTSPITLDAQPDGTYTFYAKENNRPSDPTPATSTFTIDTAAPVAFGLQSPAPDASELPSSPTLTWNATTDATTSVNHYELWIDGSKNRDLQPGDCSGGTCSAQPSSPLPEAKHDWQVIAVDMAGNAQPSEQRSFSTGVAPSVSFTVNPNPALVGRSVQFNGSASADESGISRYEWDLDGDGKFEPENASATASRSYDAPASVPISLRVTDGTGKTNTATQTLRISTQTTGQSLLGVSINEGAQFTRDPNVTLTVKAPSTANALIVSNDGGFFAPSMFPAASTIKWKLDSSGPERLPKTVYLRFQLGPIISDNYTDDIILDEVPPVVQSASLATPPPGKAASAARAKTYTVKVKAKDSNSGVSKVQVTANKRKPGKLIAYKTTLKVKSAARPKFLRAQDRAGNFSAWKKLR